MNKQGFTLVELLVAAALFLAAVSAFGYLLKTGAGSVNSASKLSHAVYALQTKMEEMRAFPFEQLLLLNGSSFDQNKGKIHIAPVLADLLSIQLELKWSADKNPLYLHSLRSKY